MATYALPEIHYKFESANPTLNSGTSGASKNIVLATNTTVAATGGLNGSGCLQIANGGSTASSATCRTSGGGMTLAYIYTFSMWIKSSSFLANKRILELTHTSGIKLYWSSSTAIYLDLNGSVAIMMTNLPQNMFDGNYHHYVFVFAPFPTNLRVYVDGIFYGSQQTMSMFNEVVSGITLGANATASNPHLNGSIDDFRYYPYQLDVTQIDMLYKIGNNVNLSTLNSQSIPNLFNSGASFSQLLSVGKTVSQLIAAGYTINALYDGGLTFVQLLNGAVTVSQLIAAGYTINALYDGGLTFVQLLNGGVTGNQLIAAGYTITTLYNAGITFSQLLTGGVTVSQFVSAGYSFSALIAGGATIGQLTTGGATASQFIETGSSYNWFDLSAVSNVFNKSYLNGFVDISGHLIIRNDGALVVGGDVSLNAVSVTGSTLFTNDMLLKSRLFLGGDISANGKLYVGGDLSVNGLFNGVLNGGFGAGTIPSTAVIGYTTGSVAGDIAITGNVLIAGDASFNGTNVGLGTNAVLRVGGQLDLSDGTYMTTYDDNILSGSYANGNVVFKNSTFSSVTVNGAATVGGSITSTSDYRIKTNVMELGETDNVDQLIPIQYNNALTNSHEYGVLAHDLQAVYPDLVKGEKDGPEYQRVYYNGLIGVLVKEVQELKRRLAALE